MPPETPEERRARIIEETRQELAQLEKLSDTIPLQRAALELMINERMNPKDGEHFDKLTASLYDTVTEARAEMVRQITALLSLIDKFDNPQT